MNLIANCLNHITKDFIDIIISPEHHDINKMPLGIQELIEVKEEITDVELNEEEQSIMNEIKVVEERNQKEQSKKKKKNENFFDRNYMKILIGCLVLMGFVIYINFKGMNKEKKPSVKEKLDHYRAKSKQQKEAERKEPKVNKAKTNQKNFNEAMVEMQEKVKMLSTEWDKKLKTERGNYETIITELEAKHKTQLDNIFHEHQIEINNKNLEIEKYKQSADLLKNFEKEYIRISEHEKKVNEIIAQTQEKYDKEYEAKKTALDLEMQKKLSKIENDKKMEYEYLTDNIKSNLKRSEKENYDMKNKIIQLENQINLHDTKSENYTKEINKLTYNLIKKENERIDKIIENSKLLEHTQIKNYETKESQKENPIENSEFRDENWVEISKNLQKLIEKRGYDWVNRLILLELE